MRVPVPEEIRMIRDLITALRQRGARRQAYLDTDKLQITRNRQFCDALTGIDDSNEIAFISRPGSF